MSATPDRTQNAFHERLTRYVNGGFARRSTLALSLASGRVAWRVEAPAVIAAFQDCAPARRPATLARPDRFTIVPYTGSNPYARRMGTALAPLAPHLAAACVHGSIGSSEEVGYSDFDALVVLRDKVFDSADTLAEVAFRLSALRRIMFEYDPLQHHGWFVLVEGDLQNYCEAWFPAALFPWSRSLLPGGARTLVIRSRDSGAEFREAFSSLADSTLREVTAGPPLEDAYRLKGVLSRFMLLPSLYLQARDGTTVFKRESFDLAARDFPAGLWSPMDRVSQVRLVWRYEISRLQRLALTRCLSLRRPCTRWFAPRVPDAIRQALPHDLWAAAAALIRAMQERLASGGR
jgi:hypothetical protein